MSAFAVLRDTADLRLACDDLSALLALRLQLAPDAPAAALLGLWVDPEMAAALPLSLTLPDSLPGAGIRIRETHSCARVWTLCWLEGSGGAAGEGPSREALLSALLTSRPEPPTRAANHIFIPVFGAGAGAAAHQIDGQLARLRAVHPNCVGSPLFQDLRTGRLSPRALP